MSAVAAGLCLSFSSCTNDYESFNRNPNGVTKDETQRDAYAMRSAMLNLEGWVIPTDVTRNSVYFRSKTDTRFLCCTVRCFGLDCTALFLLLGVSGRSFSLLAVFPSI